MRACILFVLCSAALLCVLPATAKASTTSDPEAVAAPAPVGAADATAHAPAPPASERTSLFREAMRFVAEEDWAAAEQKFRAAFALNPTYDIAANLGQTQYRLGKHAEAANHLAFALTVWPVVGKHEPRVAAERRIRELRPLVASLTIKVSAAGAAVAIDGATIGRAPLDREVFVEPGAHTISAKLEGHDAVETINAAKGATIPVTLTLATADWIEAHGAMAAAPGSAPDEVDVLFAKGKAAFGEGRIDLAHDLLLRAWALRQTHDIAGNLAQIELMLGKRRDAAQHIAFSLAHFPPTVRTSRREMMRATFAELRAELGVLRISVSPPEAKVSVDGKPIEASIATSEVFVEPGTHTVSASLEGYATTTRTIDTPNGSGAAVTLTLPYEPTTGRLAAVGGVISVSGLAAGAALMAVLIRARWTRRRFSSALGRAAHGAAARGRLLVHRRALDSAWRHGAGVCGWRGHRGLALPRR
jgi:tetratricopeptide (TPR) repeat protein